jgi:hypothetical protein
MRYSIVCLFGQGDHLWLLSIPRPVDLPPWKRKTAKSKATTSANSFDCRFIRATCPAMPFLPLAYHSHLNSTGSPVSPPARTLRPKRDLASPVFSSSSHSVLIEHDIVRPCSTCCSASEIPRNSHRQLPIWTLPTPRHDPSPAWCTADQNPSARIEGFASKPLSALKFRAAV